MEIVKFGHYYKHKTHTYNMVEKITVLDILDDEEDRGGYYVQKYRPGTAGTLA